VQLDVFDGANRVGYITTVRPGAQMTTPLDRIGAFSFSCSASDPDAGSLANGRTVFGYDGGLIRIAGIIGTIVEAVDGQGVPILQVSGDAIARELVHARTGLLDLREAGFVRAVSVFDLKIDPATGGAVEGPNDQPSAYDANVATYSEESVGGVDWWRVYIGAVEPFTKLHFICSPGLGVSGAFGGQYFNGSSWEAFTVTSDGTATGGDTFQHDGDIEFTLSVGDSMEQTTEQGRAAYFIRCNIGVTSNKARIYDVHSWGHIPTATALALVAAAFPTTGNGYAHTWELNTVMGLAATVKTDVYDTIARGTVFEALTKLAELTGEHFFTYFETATSTGKVVWIGNTYRDSGIHIYSPPVPSLVENDATVGFLTKFSVTKDSHERVTRVYPHGAGLGDGSLDLTYTTKVAPAGYALSKVNNYIRIDPEGTRIDAELDLKDIGPVTADQRARENAADALFSAALVWLGRHSSTVETYEVECTKLAAQTVRPGDTVWVEYREYVAGQLVINVNDDNLIVSSITETFGESDVVSVTLTVSTVAEWPVTDDEFLTRMYRNQRAMGSTPQAVGVGDVRTSDFAVSGRALTTGAGGLVYGGSSPASGSGGSGGGGMAIHDIVGGWHSVAVAAAGEYLRSDSTTSFVWAVIADADLPTTIVRTSRTVTGSGWLGGGGDLSDHRAITLNTPAAVSASSLNSDATNHSHTVDAVDTSIAAVDLMRTNATGGFTFADVSRLCSTTLTPFDGAGYFIDGTGQAYFQTLYANEMHAKSFIADLEQALAGGQIICKSVAPLAAAFTLPAAEGIASFIVQEFQGFPGYRVFVNGDLVRFRNFSRDGESLTITDAWGLVDYVGRDATAQTQEWNFIRSVAAGGLAGYLSPNLLVNGDFETAGGGGADVFGTWSESAGSGAIAAETTLIHGGAKACKLTAGAVDNNGISQVVTVTASTLYHMGMWVRGDGTNGSRYDVYDITHSAYIVVNAATGVTAATYTYVEYSFTTPAGCVSISLILKPAAVNGAIVYFDDVSLVKVGAGGSVIPKGALVLDYGTSGNGYIESVAQAGAMALSVPYLTMRTWTTHPGTTLTEMVHIGNMAGTYGVTGQYFGMGFGNYAAGAGDYLKYDSNGGLEMAIGGGKFRYTATGQSIYESGTTHLFNWYDTSAVYVADDYIQESGAADVSRYHRIFRASAYGAGGFIWQLFPGTLAVPGTADDIVTFTAAGIATNMGVKVGAAALGNPATGQVFAHSTLMTDQYLRTDGSRIYLGGATNYIGLNGGKVSYWDGSWHDFY
jgi:hypothetical protein